jgi:hypothetical protein
MLRVDVLTGKQAFPRNDAECARAKSVADGDDDHNELRDVGLYSFGKARRWYNKQRSILLKLVAFIATHGIADDPDTQDNVTELHKTVRRFSDAVKKYRLCAEHKAKTAKNFITKYDLVFEPSPKPTKQTTPQEPPSTTAKPTTPNPIANVGAAGATCAARAAPAAAAAAAAASE